MRGVGDLGPFVGRNFITGTVKRQRARWICWGVRHFGRLRGGFWFWKRRAGQQIENL